MKYKDYIITDSISGLSRNQDDLFTSQHKKFNLTITIQKTGLIRKKRFDYQYSTKRSKFEKGDGILAIIYDALAYTQSSNISDFIKCFGYENDFKNGEKAYLECKDTWDFLQSVGLNCSDLESIRDKIEN